MKRKTYLEVHKNKRAKQAKYSKLYTKLQLKKMKELFDIFMRETRTIKNII